MAVPPIVVKAAAAAVTSRKTWKAAAVFITAALMPFIIIILIVMTVFSGAGELARKMIDSSFSAGGISDEFLPEHKEAIEKMRLELKELEREIEVMKDNRHFDANFVRASYYCLRMGVKEEDEKTDFDYIKFCKLFEGRNINEVNPLLNKIASEFPDTAAGVEYGSMIIKVYEYLNKEIYPDCNSDYEAVY